MRQNQVQIRESCVHRSSLPSALRTVVFKAMLMLTMDVFWDVAPCSLADDDRRFRAYSLQHRATSQKTAILMLFAMKTSNVTNLNSMYHM
jgi:chloramphenicol 3-O-phosphotransferase